MTVSFHSRSLRSLENFGRCTLCDCFIILIILRYEYFKLLQNLDTHTHIILQNISINAFVDFRMNFRLIVRIIEAFLSFYKNSK